MDSRNLSQQTSMICALVYAIVALYGFLASSAAALLQGEYSSLAAVKFATQAGVTSAYLQCVPLQWSSRHLG